MNCCDYDCTQGRNCPARKQRVREAKQLLDAQDRSDRLRERMARSRQKEVRLYQQLERVIWALIFGVIGLAAYATRTAP